MNNFLSKVNADLNKQVNDFKNKNTSGITESVQNIYFQNKHTIFYAEDNYRNVYLSPEFNEQQYNDFLMYENKLTESEDFDNKTR